MALYAYSRGISSAREMERECAYELGFRWLTGLKVINHHTLSDFRVEHGRALQDLFIQVLGIFTLEKLITLERVTVDGTKVRAAVNKKTFSRAEKIREHLKVAREHVEALQKQEEEQEKRTRQASARRRAARERTERLKSALEQVQRLQAEKKSGREKPCQASSSDADAQFMQTSDHGVAPAYNVQLATDGENKLIVDVEVSKHPADSEHLLPALDRLQQRLGSFPQQVLADGSYTTRESVAGAAERGVDYYGSWTDLAERWKGYGIAAEYRPSAFVYEARSNELICPEGRRLKFRSAQEEAGGLKVLVYAAQKTDCQACPKRSLCTRKNAMQKQGRAVSIRVVPPDMAGLSRQDEKRGSQSAVQTAGASSGISARLVKRQAQVGQDAVSRNHQKARTEALWACLIYNLQTYFKLRQPLAA